MSDKLFKVAEQYTIKLAAKTKMSRKQMEKQLFKSKTNHKRLQVSLDQLQKQDTKLQKDLLETSNALKSERKTIQKIHEALEKMDFADSDEAIFHDNNDVSYVVDGKENHVELDADGHITLTPMRQYRKSKRKSVDDYGICDKYDDDDEDDLEDDDLEDENEANDRFWFST